jgi:hypothetical protein
MCVATAHLDARVVANVEARELSDALYGFDNDDEANRYVMAEQFRDDAVRLAALHCHLTSEESVKAVTYNALRVIGVQELSRRTKTLLLQAPGRRHD